MEHKVCPLCGGSLDFGEYCDCETPRGIKRERDFVEMQEIYRELRRERENAGRRAVEEARRRIAVGIIERNKERSGR